MSVKRMKPVPSEIKISQAADLLPIVKVAAGLGLAESDLELYGRYKAKVHLDLLERLRDRPLGRYVEVTAITPTPLGVLASHNNTFTLFPPSVKHGFALGGRV